MLVGVVRTGVADPVALGEGAVQQDEVGFGLAQDFQQTRRSLGKQVDDRTGVGVGRAVLSEYHFMAKRVIFGLSLCRPVVVGNALLAAYYLSKSASCGIRLKLLLARSWPGDLAALI